MYFLFILLALFSFQNTFAADIIGDIQSGQTKSVQKQCISCHGLKGISNSPLYPNIAGQKREYLTSSLQAYKTGDRQNAVMNAFASGLNEQDIADLAAYFSNVEWCR